jgi:hypothetical protein
MNFVARARKSLEAERVHRRASLGSFLALVSLAAPLMGCNIVQGFQDAGDSLFPEQSTHLAAPGLRLVSGGYHELGLAAGSELYLLAREPNDSTGKLFAMRYAKPEPCLIPNVARYTTTREPSRNQALVAYFHENLQKSTLHFADTSCKRYDLEFADALLPVGETEKSVVVWAGSDLWLATPETGSQELLVSNLQEVFGGVFGRRYGVRAGGRVGVFGSDWKEQGFFGDQVTSVQRAGKSLFYADSTGVHRIVEAKDDSKAVEDRLLVADACLLSTQDGIWLSFRSPCSAGRLMVIHEPSGRTYTLPFDADPRQLRLVPALKSPGQDPLKDPFWFFFLRDGATEQEKGQLIARTPTGDERVLGSRSTLLQLRLVQSASETHGYALVDVSGETGRYVWWNSAGETRTLAEKVMWRTRRVMSDFDGTLANLAVASGDRLQVLAKRVPWQIAEYQDSKRQWTVVFSDVQGDHGTLSAFEGNIDALQDTAPDKPFQVPALTPIASKVSAFRTSSLNDVLSGVIYFLDFDSKTGTGRLEYRNQELRFTAHVNDDVSGYVVSHDEVLYTIPYGENAGIWLVSAK